MHTRTNGERIIERIKCTINDLHSCIRDLRDSYVPLKEEILPYDSKPAYIRMQIRMLFIRKLPEPGFDSNYIFENLTEGYNDNTLFGQIIWDVYNASWEVLPLSILGATRYIQWIPLIPSVNKWLLRNLFYIGTNTENIFDDENNITAIDSRHLADHNVVVYNPVISRTFKLDGYYMFSFRKHIDISKLQEQYGVKAFIECSSNKQTIYRLFKHVNSVIRYNPCFASGVQPPIIFNLPDDF